MTGNWAIAENKREMVPRDIKVLLHYYTQDGADHETVVKDPGVAVELLASELLTTGGRDRASYQLTERGRVFCEALQRVPLPLSTWVIEWPSE